MVEAKLLTVAVGKRRGHGEDSIYFDAIKNRYMGAVSLGFSGDGRRLRRKVSGKTKAEVRQKLNAALDIGMQPPASYTVHAAVDDWLAEGLSGRSQRTLTLYRDGVKPLTDKIGRKQLRKLTAADVRSALAGLSGQMSTRSLQIATAWCGRSAMRRPETSLGATSPRLSGRLQAGWGGRPRR